MCKPKQIFFVLKIKQVLGIVHYYYLLHCLPIINNGVCWVVLISYKLSYLKVEFGQLCSVCTPYLHLFIVCWLIHPCVWLPIFFQPILGMLYPLSSTCKNWNDFGLKFNKSLFHISSKISFNHPVKFTNNKFLHHDAQSEQFLLVKMSV